MSTSWRNLRLPHSREVRTAALGALALGVVCCTRAPQPDPRAVFVSASDALHAIETVRYRFRFTPRDDPYYANRLDGTAIIQRLDSSGSHYAARVRSTVTPPEGDAFDLEVIRDGETVAILDERDRTLTVSALAAFGNRLEATLSPALLYAFYDAAAVGSEAEAESVAWENRSEIGGEPCQWIRVGYADDDEDSRWCLGERDSLPRVLDIVSASGQRTLEILDLEVEPALDPTTFQIVAPPGYRAGAAAFGPTKGSAAEPWALRTSDGTKVSLQSLRGSVVVLDFFATWCPPCQNSLQSLERHLEHYSDRPVRGFAVDTLESAEPPEVAAFLAELGVTYPLLLEGDPIHAAYAEGALPAVVVLDGSGRHVGIANGYFGERSDRYVERLIEEALAATSH